MLLPVEAVVAMAVDSVDVVAIVEDNWLVSARTVVVESGELDWLSPPEPLCVLDGDA